MKTTAVYARVSGADQNLEGQLEQLRHWLKGNGIADAEWYVEKASSRAWGKRKEFDRLQKDVFAGKVKAVVVYKALSGEWGSVYNSILHGDGLSAEAYSRAMSERHALSDGQWEKVEGMLPQNGKRGGQWKDHRQVVNGILWILATGSPWRDLPEEFGKWKTVYERFRLWCQNGFWDRLLDRLQARRHAAGQIDWELFCIDGSSVRAHKAAAGAAHKGGPEGEPDDHALGRSRGGFGTKLHLVCEGGGLPIAIEVSPGQEHESRHVEPIMQSISVSSPRGAPRRRPEKLVGDKGYSAGWIREWLKRRKIEPVIAYRENEAGREGPFDRESYRQRNIIERCIGWIKELRRIATRYEKLAIHYLGMLKLAMILQYLKPEPQT